MVLTIFGTFVIFEFFKGTMVLLCSEAEVRGKSVILLIQLRLTVKIPVRGTKMSGFEKHRDQFSEKWISE